MEGVIYIFYIVWGMILGYVLLYGIYAIIKYLANKDNREEIKDWWKARKIYRKSKKEIIEKYGEEAWKLLKEYEDKE